jgi:hypothetical protein
MSPADAAVAYAQRQLAVFPVWPAVPFRDGQLACGCGRLTCENAAKHPIGMLARNGVSDGTFDVDRVRHWWWSKPDANVAISCTGLVVLDIDPRHGGDESLIALEQQHDVLPGTWMVRTGGGGTHFYFAAPDRIDVKNSSGKLAAGIDIRTRGGYVLAPPSRHVCGGCYRWLVDPDEVALAALLAWLVEALTRPQVTPPEEWRELIRVGPADGSRARQEAIARLSGHLLRRHVDAQVTLDLVECWNRLCCDPPLGGDEIATIVHAINVREQRRRAQLKKPTDCEAS